MRMRLIMFTMAAKMPNIVAKLLISVSPTLTD